MISAARERVRKHVPVRVRERRGGDNVQVLKQLQAKSSQIVEKKVVSNFFIHVPVSRFPNTTHTKLNYPFKVSQVWNTPPKTKNRLHALTEGITESNLYNVYGL